MENLMIPGSSFEHVARWLTFCGAQVPFCNVADKLPTKASSENTQLGVSLTNIVSCVDTGMQSCNKVNINFWTQCF